MPSPAAIFLVGAFICSRGLPASVADAAPPPFTSAPLGAATGVNDTGRQSVVITHEYYDFILQEYSFKFWQYFMLFALSLIAYTGVASTYFSRSNYVVPPPEYEYDYFGKRRRSVSEGFPAWRGLDALTMDMIMKVIEGPPNISKGR